MSELDQQGRLWAVINRETRVIFTDADSGIPTLYHKKKDAESMKRYIESFNDKEGPQVHTEVVEVEVKEKSP
jgi:hypothetical protein